MPGLSCLAGDSRSSAVFIALHRYENGYKLATTPSNGTHALREIYKARLRNKQLLCEPSQCFHLEFAIESATAFAFTPGQFLSCVAQDPTSGRQQTRAYSLASAFRPGEPVFDLCLNRVPGGFFSNLLCDLQPGDTIDAHGPHGFFTLPEDPADTPPPALVLAAAGTGIAPIRGFLQALFPAAPTQATPARTPQVWLVQGIDSTYDQSQIGPPPDSSGAFYYRKEFEQIAATYPGFHYHPVAITDEFQQQLAQIIGMLAPLQVFDADPSSRGPFPVYACLCGLNAVVAPARALFQQHGWARRQVLFERYD